MKSVFKLTAKLHAYVEKDAIVRPIPTISRKHIRSLVDGHYYEDITFPVTFQVSPLTK